MKPGDIFELKIESMSFGANAVGRFALEGDKNVVVFVSGALPKERVRVKLIKVHKNYWEADLLEVLESSPHRISPPCPVFDRCGGCQWQHIDAAFQVECKKQVLTHQLVRTTRLSKDLVESMIEVKASAQSFGYRNRIQVRGDKNGIGFYSSRSHEIVYSEGCLVAEPALQEKWAGFLREKRHQALAQKHEQFKIEWSLCADGSVSESINSRHGALGFSQVNSRQNLVMQEIVRDAIVDRKCKQKLLIDFYGGSGNFSKNLTNDFETIFCIDSFNAGKKLTHSQKLGQGFHLLEGQVEGFFQKKLEFKPDVVIADPPREGLKGVSKRIAALNARTVVLISCDPSTLARDLTDFLPQYKMRKLVLVDLFPQTYHIETVVVLDLQQDAS